MMTFHKLVSRRWTRKRVRLLLLRGRLRLSRYPPVDLPVSANV